MEWKFTLPLGHVAPDRLARLFREHGQGGAAYDYAAHLETLGRREVHGYLTGIVDLIIQHDDRWFVIDWKSNHLGSSLEDYGAPSLWQAMAHHHYVLQYHLYVFALHRFLSRRLPDYDYERHMADTYYVFLRGLDGEAENGETPGWYVDRPPRALIEAMGALMK